MTYIEGSSYLLNKNVKPTPDGVEAVILVHNDFESRKCENCKHGRITSATDSYDCYMNIDDNSNFSYNQIVNKDFGCNKWEAKNE